MLTVRREKATAESWAVDRGSGIFGKVRDMNRQRGFTLMELIITVAIAAIVLAVGVPSFQGMMRNNRAATQANEMIAALNLARSEAAKRGSRVSLCPSSSGTGCGGTDWSSGWIVFVDTAATDASAPVVGQVLRVFEKLSDTPTFTGPASVRYRAAGGITPTAPQQLSYTLYTVKQAICISPVGRPRVVKETTTCP